MSKHLSSLTAFLALLVFCPSAFAADGSSTDMAKYFGPSPLNAGIDIQYVPVSYRNYVWTNDQRSQATGHGLHLAVEWIPLDERYGKLGIGAGTGFYVIRNVDFGGTKATLSTIPIEGIVSYRFDYFANQVLVPFVKLGISHTLAMQKGIEIAGTRGFTSWDKGAGLQLNLGVFDASTAKRWDRRSGVNNTYLIVEYFRTDALGSKRDPDLTSEQLRIGLRFEL